MSVSLTKPTYRVYYLNAEGRAFAAARIEAGDDGQAVATARRLADRSSVELWDRARRIAYFEGGAALPETSRRLT